MKRSILYVSILVFLFWTCSRFINVYRFALVGAIFEILWLPMILMLFCLPVISCYYLFKEKFSIHSTYLYVFLLMLFTFLILSLQGQTEIEMIVKRNRELHIIEIFQDSVGC